MAAEIIDRRSDPLWHQFGVRCPACGAWCNLDEKWTLGDDGSIVPSIRCACGKPGAHFFVVKGEYRMAEVHGTKAVPADA